MNSATAERDFGQYPALMRQAISIARRLQDPLIEFAQLVNADDDLACLRLHPAQEMVGCLSVRLAPTVHYAD